jgi:signal transduction histidine kinase
MKLLVKTNLYFIGASILVFGIGGVFFYFLFQVIIDRDLTTKVKERKTYVVKQMEKSDSLMLYQRYSANTLSIIDADVAKNTTDVISDTVIYDDVEHKSIRYRQLSFSPEINGKGYKIHIRRALVETKDLIKGVIALEVILFLAFAAVLAMLNNQLSKRIWKPFHHILDTISNYKVDRAESLSFQRHSITEFNELATAIEKMSAKINHEFNSQKEFTENASHEIQTPLAIIKNKLEVLLQTAGLNEDQMSLISAASTAANRLSKLNEALIILSRIENRQFHKVENISVNDLMDRHLSSLDELIHMKKITVKRLYRDVLSIKMNPYLAEIFLENLIVNSIKHNCTPGFISISIDANMLSISNAGAEPMIEPDRLFQRFTRANHKSQSLGLGLSIVKAICDTYLIPINYKFENKVHIVSVEFQHGNSSW